MSWRTYTKSQLYKMHSKYRNGEVVRVTALCVTEDVETWTWTSWRLKSLTARLLSLFRQTPKFRVTGPLLGKGPLIQTVFPCPNLIMKWVELDAPKHQDLYSLSGRTSYRRKISWNLECREIWVYTFSIALKCDKRLGNRAAEMHVNSQSDMINITFKLAASRLREIWW